MRPISSSTLAAALLIVTLGGVSCAPAYYSNGSSGTYLGFSLGIASAPPPPTLAFGGDPHLDPIEGSTVRLVEAPDPNCDMFEYRGVYYVYDAGYWYRGERVDGPFRVIEVHRVPRAVLTVPDQHWRHRPRHVADDRGEREARDDRRPDRR